MELRELLTQVFAGSLSAQIELISTFQDFGYNIKLIKAEEEKKMLNFDKYREEIDRIIENGGAPHRMISRLCLQKTNLESVNADGVLDWLFSEYEQPLLQNGDSLKPGDWIMVRDCDDSMWRKCQFLCFIDGEFHTRKDIGGYFSYVDYKQARLPEDGE